MDDGKKGKPGTQGELVPNQPKCDHTVTKGPKKGTICGVKISDRGKSDHLCARHFLCVKIK